jgi:hypothetical protein
MSARLLRFLPLILFLAFYWPGLTIWFYQDDFGWLNLRHEVDSIAGLPAALFSPKAHGNIRPWSENGFFLLLSVLFGVEPLPFRAVVLATQMANLLLLGAIARRITGSDTAAFWTQILWIANSCLAVAACWTSIYNQFQYVFFILLAFWLLLRYIETGDRRYFAAQWAAYLLGFGALEVNVMYPALASAYAWMFARQHLRGILPMFGVSALYAVVHFWAAPAAKSGPYALHFDFSVIPTLWTYWRLSLGPDRLARFVEIPSAAVLGAVCALTGAAALFAWRDRIARLGLAWFVILLVPLLPLRDHVTDYYVTGPAAGLALLGGWAIVRHKPAWAPVACYLAMSIPAAWMVTQWHAARAEAVRNLVLGVAEIREKNPERIILLSGVSTDLFLAGVADASFRALEIPRVYLAPGSERNIAADPGLVSKFVLPEGIARQELLGGKAVAFDCSGPVLRNVTSRIRALAESAWTPGPPRMVNPGDPVFDPWLGPGWDPPRNGCRRVRKTAVIRIAGARSAAERLHLGLFPDHPVSLHIRVNGADAGSASLPQGRDLVELLFPAPVRGEIEVTVETSAPVTFGFFEIR